MGLSIGEVFIELGFDLDDSKLKSFDEQLKSARNELFKITAAATGALYAIGEFISGPINKASVFKQFTDQTGYSSQALQEWARVASTVNNTLSFDNAIAKYKAFSEYVQKAQFGGGGGALSQLGVKFVPGKDPKDYLSELSEAARSGVWQQLYHENWRSAVSQLLSTTGLGTDFIDALMTTSAQRASMTKGMTMGEGMVENLDRVNTMVRQLGRDWEKFTQDMTAKYGDRIIEFLRKFEEFIAELLPKIDEFAQRLGGWQTVGELVLAYFATTWAVGMLASISKVATALLAVSAAGGGGLLASIAGGAAGLLGAGGAAAVGGSALALGASIPLFLDQKFGWGQKFADWAMPVLDQTNNITIYSNGQSPQELAAELRRELDYEERKANQQIFNQVDLGAER